MKLEDLLIMCWRSAIRNRRRYKAVVIGIALGTAGFIIVQTMGDSVEKKMGEHLELLGEATVMKAVWRNDDNYHPGEYDFKDVKRLRAIPNMMAVAPVVSMPAVDAFFEDNEWNAGLIGVDQEFWMTQSSQLKQGRLIGATDVVGRRNVCVLGEDVVKFLFGMENPVGYSLGVGSLKFEVIGVLGGIQQNNLQRYIVIPLSTAQNLFSGLEKIREIYIRVSNWNDVESIREQALEILREGHKGYEQGIDIKYYPKRIDKVKSTVYLVKLFVYAALGVTVLLAGLGIMAVMLSAVQDRTREIGLRKALGAKEELILLQFLLEAVLVSLMAGTVGVIVGVLSVSIFKGPLGVQISGVTLFMSVIGGILFTAFLGIASGLYPSLKASRMDSVTAMRFE
ncbi:MAG: ABC transporter permease [Desulfomonilaceae bacterium]